MKRKLFLLFLLGMLTKSFAQFTEGFEYGIPSNWTVINGGEVTTWGQTSTTIPNTEPYFIHSGTGVAGISSLWLPQDDYLITPAITVVAGVNDRISFWCARFYYDTEPEEGMEVMISTTTPDAEGMAAIDDIAPEIGGSYNPKYKKYYYDLSGYIGQTIYMGFRATHTQAWRLFIDDVVNDALPTTAPGCNTITYPANGATNVDTVGLLQWTAVPGITGYAIQLGTTPGGAEIFGTLDVSDVTTKSIGPLDLATTYYVKIIPYNDIGPALGCIEYSFTTRSEILGDICSTAIDLSTLPATFTSTTAGAGDDDFACYTWTGPDIFYTIIVPDGSTLSIRQTYNNYQSANTLFYGHCTNRTQIYCGITTDIYNPVTWHNTTGTAQQVYWIQYGAGWDEDQNEGEFTIEWSLSSCDFPVVSYQTISNCEATPGFFANVNVTDMGSATTLHITDNQGSTMQAATATGVVQFGPYPIGTPVIFTVANASEASCKITSNPVTLAVCPPACSAATVVTEGVPVACVIEAGAGAWNFDASSPGREKLYSFTPAITGNYSLETVWDGENLDELPINTLSLFFKAADLNCGTGWNYMLSSDFFGGAPLSSEELIAGTEYLILLDAWETTGSFNKFQIVYQVPPCSSAVVTHTVISDCTEGSDFYVDLNISSLGTATSHVLWFGTVAGPQEYGIITEPGVINLGPFPYGSHMSYSLTNASGCTGVYSSGWITQLLACPNFYPACPPLTFPANAATNVPLQNSNGLAELTLTWDAPVGSITTGTYSIFVGLSPTSLSYITYTSDLSISLIGFTANTTYYWKIMPSTSFDQYLINNPPACEVRSFTTGAFIPNGYCLNGGQGQQGVFTPSCDGTSEVVVQGAYAGYYEYVDVTEGEVYTFTSTGTNPSGMPDLISIGSEDGETALAWANSPLTWTANMTGIVRFYIHLSNLCQGDELGRTKSVSCGTLTTPVFDISMLKAYPNPVKDMLNLTFINGIQDVSVFNLLGQEVIVKTVNASEAHLDLQALPSGTYLVKVHSADNQIQTIKIVKE